MKAKWAIIIIALWPLSMPTIDGLEKSINANVNCRNVWLNNTLSVNIYSFEYDPNNYLTQFTIEQLIINYQSSAITIDENNEIYLNITNYNKLNEEYFIRYLHILNITSIMESPLQLIKDYSLAIQNYRNLTWVFHYINRSQQIHYAYLVDFYQAGKFTFLNENLEGIQKILPISTTDQHLSYDFAFLHFITDHNYALLVNQTLFNRIEFKRYVHIELRDNELRMKFTVWPPQAKNSAKSFFKRIRFGFAFRNNIYLVSIENRMVYSFHRSHLKSNLLFPINQRSISKVFACSKFENNSKTLDVLTIVLVLALALLIAIFIFIYCKNLKRMNLVREKSEFYYNSPKQALLTRRLNVPFKNIFISFWSSIKGSETIKSTRQISKYNQSNIPEKSLEIRENISTLSSSRSWASKVIINKLKLLNNEKLPNLILNQENSINIEPINKTGNFKLQYFAKKKSIGNYFKLKEIDSVSAAESGRPNRANPAKSLSLLIDLWKIINTKKRGDSAETN